MHFEHPKGEFRIVLGEPDFEHQGEAAVHSAILPHGPHARAEARERDPQSRSSLSAGGRQHFNVLLRGGPQSDGQRFTILSAQVDAPGAVFPRVRAPGFVRAQVLDGKREGIGAKHNPQVTVRQNPVFHGWPCGPADAANRGLRLRLSRGRQRGSHYQG